MTNEGSLRALTPAVVFVKLRKLIDSKVPNSEICKRINFPDESCIDTLVQLLDSREAFYAEIELINQAIKQKRSAANGQRILQELRIADSVPEFKCTPSTTIDWLAMPKHVVPDMMSLGTYLAGKRKDWKGLARRVLHCGRKRKQLETFIGLLEGTVAGSGQALRVLDLCGGRGDLALMLAFKNPEWSVTVFDRNKLGLAQAEYRAGCLGLENFDTREVDLFNLDLTPDDKWDVVIGLHACGSLTDVILQEFTNRSQHVFVATCCFGKMEIPHKFSRYADADSGGVNSETSRLAKLVINSERCTAFASARILEVDEASFSSKNQIIHIHNSPSS